MLTPSNMEDVLAMDSSSEDGNMMDGMDTAPDPRMNDEETEYVQKDVPVDTMDIESENGSRRGEGWVDQDDSVPLLVGASTDSATSGVNDANGMKLEQSLSSSEASELKTQDWNMVEQKGETKHDAEVCSDRGSDNESMFSFSDGSESDFEVVKMKAAPALEPFDMRRLKTLLERSNDALEKISGKDVVLVVGKTGTGKSTLIQGIAGKKFTQSQHMTDYHGQPIATSVFEAEDPLLGFEIGHSKMSETKFVKAFEREVGSNFVYVDTPGLEDSSGLEMDIATSVAMSQIAANARSLRFVVLIHCASLVEDRGGALRSVLKFANGFVSDFYANRRSFMFLFTHANEISNIEIGSTKSSTKWVLDQIIRNIEGIRSENVALSHGILPILDFIRKSLSKGYPFATTIHPINMDCAKLSAFIESRKGMSGYKLFDKKKHTFLSHKACTRLSAEARKLLADLRIALQDQCPDFGVVSGIQETIHFLADNIEVDELRALRTSSDRQMETFVSRHCELLFDMASRAGDPSQIFPLTSATDLRMLYA